MNFSEEKERYYIDIQAQYPLYENPLLGRQQPYQEVLIHCICGAHYRILANGAPEDLSINCRNCGKSISECVGISFHSGDVFNAYRTNIRKKEQ